jgi:hypothetical protein
MKKIWLSEEKLGRILTILVDDAVGLWQEGVFTNSVSGGIVAFLEKEGYEIERDSCGDPFEESVFKAVVGYIYT